MDKRLNLVFFGTSGICLPFLEQLYRDYRFFMPLIVTQPDTFGGRNRNKRIIPEVKIFALEKGIDVIQPETLKDEAVIQQIENTEPEIGVVISYGKLIPKRVFRLPRCRTVNVHFSLLPSYRGAAPVQRALENGDQKSGITIFEIIRKLDAGAIWTQKEMDILPDDTTTTLWERMSREGAPFLIETLHAIVDGTIEKKPQDHVQATVAPPVEKHEGNVDWQLTAPQIYNKFRAFTPWPGLCALTGDKRFKLTKIKVSDVTHNLEPGTMMGWDKKCLRICCGSGTMIDILEFQPQGKKPMSPYNYCQGNDLPDCF